MIILTERLNLIANNINNGEKVADIGTDHGYLPLYLWENKISPKVILTDVSKGSLNKAKDNCERLFPNEKFDLREGDGFEPLEKGEVDTVVIAGMGGILISDIFNWDISKSLSFKKYILQPRNNGGYLRKYLFERGFIMEKLLIVPEERRFCEIMVVSSPDDYDGVKELNETPMVEFDFPSELSNNVTGYEREDLLNCLAIEEGIKSKIQEGLDPNSAKAGTDLKFREERIERIKNLLK